MIMGILDQGVDWSGVDETSQGDFSPIRRAVHY